MSFLRRSKREVRLFEFTKTYGGRRVERDSPLDFLWNEPRAGESEDEENSDERKIITALDIEVPADEWHAITPHMPARWSVRDWAEHPVRFIDGKDVGQTVMWFRGLEGHPIPVRLAEIGGVAMRIVNGECRREFVSVERVVSMVTSAFPWEQVEDLAIALQKHGISLRYAIPPDGELSFDFEKMRSVTRHQTNYGMNMLEEIALAQDSETPTIVDGSLESHEGGFDATTSPVFGVIKKHRKNYLHPLGLQLL